MSANLKRQAALVTSRVFGLISEVKVVAVLVKLCGGEALASAASVDSLVLSVKLPACKWEHAMSSASGRRVRSRSIVVLYASLMNAFWTKDESKLIFGSRSVHCPLIMCRRETTRSNYLFSPGALPGRVFIRECPVGGSFGCGRYLPAVD